MLHKHFAELNSLCQHSVFANSNRLLYRQSLVLGSDSINMTVHTVNILCSVGLLLHMKVNNAFIITISIKYLWILEKKWLWHLWVWQNPLYILRGWLYYKVLSYTNLHRGKLFSVQRKASAGTRVTEPLKDDHCWWINASCSSPRLPAIIFTWLILENSQQSFFHWAKLKYKRNLTQMFQCYQDFH